MCECMICPVYVTHTTGACWYESTNFNLNVFFIFVCQSHNRFICEWAVNVIRKMCVLATNHLPSENNRKRKWRVEQVMVVLWCTLMILKLSFSFHFDEQHRRVCRFSVRFMISILVPVSLCVCFCGSYSVCLSVCDFGRTSFAFVSIVVFGCFFLLLYVTSDLAFMT